MEKLTNKQEKILTTIKKFIADNGYAKLNIALARGKKEYDKRHTIKENDIRRQEDRYLR